MMWFLLLLHTLAHFGPVSSDSKQGKIILRSKNNPCEGHVEAYYDGEKGYVGDKHWSKKTEEVVCRTTHCGRPEGSENVYRSLRSKVWLNELKCEGNEKSLWDCGGWPGPEISFYKKPTVKKVKCSDKISFSLKQHKCEGAVQYTIQSPDNEYQTGYICSDGFGVDESRLLCQSIGCGEFVEGLKPEWMRDGDFQDSKKAKINCAGIKDVAHLWQCVNSLSSQCALPASVRCAGHVRMQLKGEKSNVCSGQLQKEVNGTWKTHEISKTESELCKKLHCGDFKHQNETSHNLTCRDEVKVVLTVGKSETKCFGQVRIKVNGILKDVCSNDWNDEEAAMVCKELNCGKVIESESIRQGGSSAGIMNHVACNGNESSLWYCRAQHRDQKCSAAPYVICSESIEVRLEDGPSRCAGRLEVRAEGQWIRVSTDNWDNSYSKLACKMLNCGDSGTVKSGVFSPGDGAFLTVSCEKDAQSLSQCNRRLSTKSNEKEKPVELVCSENKVLFLNGNKSCSGLVGIEHGENPYWLSGSRETWNKELANIVCQQMHCGNALDISSSPSENRPIWNGSFNCSSGQNSIFDCNKKKNPPDHNQTIADVKCEGKITVSLSGNCWGTVNISTAMGTGHVSAEHWSEKLSNKLCEDLNCGTGTLAPLEKPNKDMKIIFKSVHAINLMQNLKISQYSIVKMNQSDGTRNSNPAYVVCKGSIKPRFNSFRHKCSGNVEVLYEGKWLPVSKDALKINTVQKTICEELNCGQAVGEKAYFGPRPQAGHVVTVKECSESKTAKCKDVSAKTFDNSQTSEPGGLQCSDWKTVALEVENACKGEVVVYSKGDLEPERSFISSQGWTKDEGEKLCAAMNCSDYISMKNSTIPPEDNSWWEGTFNCSSTDKYKDIWDCENQTQANAVQKTKLFIECKGEPVVKLSQTCNGDLSIDNVKVCRTQWKPDYSHRVCQQLGCGNAIPDLRNNRGHSSSGDHFYVHCDEHNYLISQCKRVKGQCNAGPVYITCSGSASFNTSEKCGGALNIKYQKEPVEVCNIKIPNELSNKLCQDLACGPIKGIQEKNNAVNLNKVGTSLNCSNSNKDPRYCATMVTCQTTTTFTCEGYVPPPPPVVPSTSLNPVPIIVGVLIILILVVLVGIFVRYRIKRRNRKSMVPPADMEEADWDSGEYEDVDKSDELEGFNRGRFRSESDFQGERDVESNRSYNYDDIDEVTEAQPLTPQGSMVRAAKDEDMQDGVVNPSDEVVTYEVDDSQENYDDIDASPEKEETAAVVHDGPRPALEGDAAAPKDQVQKDEDYLVPAQDG